MTRKTIPNSKSTIDNRQSAIRGGSAIILAIVLTTLLAILGVLFLLSSRVDSVATSAVGDNQDLKLAVDSVVAQISEVLTRNVPGDPCVPQEYYDYPDPCSNIDSWLACLEPYQFAFKNYHWRHITDINNTFWAYPGLRDIQANVVREYQDGGEVGDSTPAKQFYADADGDGISDSIWVQVPGKMSTKGKSVYAAIRIIDNGGMLNVNTGYKFDPCGPIGSIDGSSQTQINLMALAGRPGYTLFNENTLKNMRANYPVSGLDPNNLGLYEQNVIWRYGNPDGNYTPFDISDELEMRYRFLIDQAGTNTRLEFWSGQFDSSVHKYPFDNSADDNESDWFRTAYDGGSLAPDYTYRHITTTYNMDRIINPAGQKMFNINSPLNFDKNLIYNTVREALDPCVVSNAEVALITANLMDYVDGPNYPSVGDPRYDPNNEVTEVNDPCTGTPRYGFERPCVYISEIAQNFFQHDQSVKDPDPNVYRSYAIELFKPYWQDDEPNGWKLVIKSNLIGGSIYSDSNIIWTGSRRFHVLTNIDPNANIFINLNEFPGPNDFNGFDPNKFNHLPQATDVNFVNNNTTIYLLRNINGSWIPVDLVVVPDANAGGNGWLEPNTISSSHSFERDIASIHRCIRKVWSPIMTASPTIGWMNNFIGEMVGGGDYTYMIQAHPANKKFTNIGEIGQLFRNDAYNIGPADREYDFFDSNLLPPAMREGVRVDLTMPVYQNLFKYLTVMDPCDHSPIDPNETRIKGRININTAPWFVLAQLPWVTYHTQPNYNLARSIVNYRDTHGPFRNIGELMQVMDANSILSMGYYAQTPGSVFPALTPADGGSDTFELRDAIFTRISNLVTVRSDVFTAYILVRIGTDGPQKRVIAIFDRSGVTPTGGKVKIVAIQQVPDPR